jgi:glycosyltransferase involved in cell wall biosynthesis
MNVSVIIPLYNKAPYIRRTLDSVLRQSFQDFECIVVDDGSTDGSGDIVEGVKDSRLRLITQSNAGVSAARNRGIEAALYPLVAFLDADDEWLPDFLCASIKLHIEHPEIVASFTNFKRSDCGNPIHHADERGVRVLKDYFAFCLFNQGLGMCSSVVVARRETLLEVGGFPMDRKMGEDLDTWARLAWSGKIGYIPETLAIYNSVSDSACAQNLKATGSRCDIFDTYTVWKNAKLIPEKLSASSIEYVFLLWCFDLHDAVCRGQIDRYRRLCDSIPFRRRASVMVLFARLAWSLPYGARCRLLDIVKRTRNRFLACRWRARF